MDHSYFHALVGRQPNIDPDIAKFGGCVRALLFCLFRIKQKIISWTHLVANKTKILIVSMSNMSNSLIPWEVTPPQIAGYFLLAFAPL